MGRLGGSRRPESGQAIERWLSLTAPSEIIQVDAKIGPALLDQVPITRRIKDCISSVRSIVIERLRFAVCGEHAVQPPSA